MQLRSISNNKRKLQQMQTQQLEKETKVMEGQLMALKQILQQEKVKREQEKPSENNTRWKAATQNKGLRNYASNLLQQKKEKDSQLKKTTKLPERRPTSSKLQPIQFDREVEQFLNLLGLQQYKDRFANLSMQSLRKITVQQLRDLSVVPGHQIKIMRALKELPEQISEDSFCQSRISQASQYQQSETVESKQACWLCYKLYAGEPCIASGRSFCSPECVSSFLSEYMVPCAKCSRRFYKNDGCVVYDAYYCSQACTSGLEQHSIRGISANTIESEEMQQDPSEEDEPIENINLAEQFNEFLTSSLLRNQEDY